MLRYLKELGDQQQRRIEQQHPLQECLTELEEVLLRGEEGGREQTEEEEHIPTNYGQEKTDCKYQAFHHSASTVSGILSLSLMKFHLLLLDLNLDLGMLLTNHQQQIFC